MLNTYPESMKNMSQCNKKHDIYGSHQKDIASPLLEISFSKAIYIPLPYKKE
jgi:hypothetical protein